MAIASSCKDAYFLWKLGVLFPSMVVVGVAFEVIAVETGKPLWCLLNRTDLKDSKSVSIWSILEVRVVMAL